MQAESSALLAINGMHCAFFDGFMFMCSEKWVWLPFYASLLYVLLRNYSVRTALTVFFLILFTVLVTDQLSAQVMRPCFVRLRPTHMDNPIAPLLHIVNDYRGGTYGFPSSHAANGGGTAFFFVFLMRDRLLSWLMLFWLFLLSYSRLYLGVHYPSDVIVGIAVGCLCALLSYFCLCQLCRCERLRFDNVEECRSRTAKHTFVPLFVLLLTLAVFIVISASTLL